jgi:hypothetical protein
VNSSDSQSVLNDLRSELDLVQAVLSGNKKVPKKMKEYFERPRKEVSVLVIRALPGTLFVCVCVCVCRSHNRVSVLVTSALSGTLSLELSGTLELSLELSVCECVGYCACICVSIHLCTGTHECVYACICIFIYIYIYMYVCVCMCICMCACICWYESFYLSVVCRSVESNTHLLTVGRDRFFFSFFFLWRVCFRCAVVA